RYDQAAHNPFEAAGFQFFVERRAEKVFHKETRSNTSPRDSITYEAEVRYAIGSGARARSYLIDREGYLFESALTRYSQEARWDLSPGFAANPHSDRPVTIESLFCHCNHPDAVPQTANKTRPP